MLRRTVLLGLAGAGVFSRAWATTAPLSARAEWRDGGYALTWTGGPVDIYASTQASAPFEGLRRLAAGVTGGVLRVADPFPGQRSYFLVSPARQRRGVWTATRVVRLEGASNFRDIGGYVTRDGRHVRWGLVFRSNRLTDLTAADYQVLTRLGVAAICDLRAGDERARGPTHWQAGPVDMFVSPKPVNTFDLASYMAPGVTGAMARRMFIAFYADMPVSYAEEFKAMFARLVAGKVPMIVHCSAGKDRSGVAAALLLSALGVARAAVLEDYALSETLLTILPGPASGAPVSDVTADIRRVISRSDPAYLEAAFAAIERRCGSVNAYLQRQVGVGPTQIAALKARLLE